MSDDLTQLLIYAALALLGIIASAYKNKMKRRQSSTGSHGPVTPPRLPADPENGFPPELGPLADLFDIPRPKAEPPEYETVESGPAIEEAGMKVDTEVASAEMAGMTAESAGSSVEGEGIIDVPVLEEGQSEIQKMIAKYEAIRKELDQGFMQEDIASGEIVSVEDEEKAKAGKPPSESFFDLKKAIIYSEILKRKEY